MKFITAFPVKIAFFHLYVLSFLCSFFSMQNNDDRNFATNMISSGDVSTRFSVDGINLEGNLVGGDLVGGDLTVELSSTLNEVKYAPVISNSASLRWEEEISNLKGAFEPQIYTAYIKPLKFASYDSNRAELVISAPSKFLCNHVDRNLREKIHTALCEKLGLSDLSIKFSVDSTTAPSGDATLKEPYVVVKKIVDPASTTRVASRSESYSSGLNSKYTFENFVVGRSNEFSHAAALRVAEKPGKSYNPLFIYGGVGLGKTHLLHAVGNFVLKNDPTAKVLYMSSETFTNELISALRHDKMDEFKKKLRGINVLMIDDIQFMNGKERTQEEFFHTFNALYNLKQQIIITSDKIPQDITGLEERLRTRFAWGLTADLQSPDFETRVAILKRKAAFESVSLPEDVAHLISEKISSNVRELEGALTRLHAVSSLKHMSISLDLAKSALKPLLQTKRVNVSIDDIKKTVALHFNLKVSDLTSKRRTRTLSYPRHIAMYLCRKHTSTSFPEIGSQFGGRDHSSVIHAANVISLKIVSEPEVKSVVTEIEKRLLGN